MSYAASATRDLEQRFQLTGLVRARSNVFSDKRGRDFDFLFVELIESSLGCSCWIVIQGKHVLESLAQRICPGRVLRFCGLKQTLLFKHDVVRRVWVFRWSSSSQMHVIPGRIQDMEFFCGNQLPSRDELVNISGVISRVVCPGGFKIDDRFRVYLHPIPSYALCFQEGHRIRCLQVHFLFSTLEGILVFVACGRSFVSLESSLETSRVIPKPLLKLPKGFETTLSTKILSVELILLWKNKFPSSSISKEFIPRILQNFMKAFSLNQSSCSSSDPILEFFKHEHCCSILDEDFPSAIGLRLLNSIPFALAKDDVVGRLCLASEGSSCKAFKFILRDWSGCVDVGFKIDDSNRLDLSRLFPSMRTGSYVYISKECYSFDSVSSTLWVSLRDINFLDSDSSQLAQSRIPEDPQLDIHYFQPVDNQFNLLVGFFGSIEGRLVSIRPEVLPDQISCYLEQKWSNQFNSLFHCRILESCSKSPVSISILCSCQNASESCCIFQFLNHIVTISNLEAIYTEDSTRRFLLGSVPDICCVVQEQNQLDVSSHFVAEISQCIRPNGQLRLVSCRCRVICQVVEISKLILQKACGIVSVHGVFIIDDGSAQTQLVVSAEYNEFFEFVFPELALHCVELNDNVDEGEVITIRNRNGVFASSSIDPSPSEEFSDIFRLLFKNLPSCWISCQVETIVNDVSSVLVFQESDFNQKVLKSLVRNARSPLALKKLMMSKSTHLNGVNLDMFSRVQASLKLASFVRVSRHVTRNAIEAMLKEIE